MVAHAYDHSALGLIWFVSAHLDAGKEKPAFLESSKSLVSALEAAPYEASLIIGIDANSNLGEFDDHHRLVGPFTRDPAFPSEAPVRSRWKAALLYEIMAAYGLRAQNTFEEGKLGGQHVVWGRQILALPIGLSTGFESSPVLRLLPC